MSSQYYTCALVSELKPTVALVSIPSVLPLSHASYATDVDLNEHSGSFILVTIGCGNGMLTLSSAAGLHFVSGGTKMWGGDVSFDGFASFYSSLDNANKALGGLTYRPHQDWNGNDTISVTADDRGWSSEVRQPTHKIGLAMFMSRSEDAEALLLCKTCLCLLWYA